MLPTTRSSYGQRDELSATTRLNYGQRGELPATTTARFLYQMNEPEIGC
jgi:hypothetical protein